MAVTPLIADIWSARITHFLTAYSAFLPNATRQYEGDVAYGNTVKVPTVVRDVIIRDYSRTADLADPEDIDANTQDLNIDQEKYFSFILEDLDARQSAVGGSALIDIKSTGAAIKIAQVVDDHVLDTLNGVANNSLFNTANAAFDLKFTSALKEQLRINGQMQSSMVLVVTPETLKSIDDGIIDRTYGEVVAANYFVNGMGMDPTSGGPDMVPGGFVGTINGFRTFCSAAKGMKRKADGSPLNDAEARGSNLDVRSLAWCYDPMDLALVMQVNKVEMYRPEKRFATGVKGLVNYGAKALAAAPTNKRIHKFSFTD